MDNKQLARQLRLSIDGQTFVVGKAAEQVEAIYERAFEAARRKDAAELTRLRAFVDGQDLRSDFKSATEMRTEIGRLRAEVARLRRVLHAAEGVIHHGCCPSEERYAERYDDARCHYEQLKAALTPQQPAPGGGGG